MTTGQTISCRKIRRILRYHVPNKLLSSKNLLIIDVFVFSVQRWKTIAIRFSTKLQQQGVQDTVSRNKRKFEPYGDLIDQVKAKLLGLNDKSKPTLRNSFQR